MIENQSENINNKENDLSDQDNSPDINPLRKIQLLKMMNHLLKKQKK